MSDFHFLLEYVLDSPHDERRDDNSVKHTLFKLNPTDVEEIKMFIEIPLELEEFWKQIGYGFFHNSSEYSFDRFLPPDNFKIINLREDFYEFDPDLEIYETYPDRVIFMEIVEGTYLTMDKKAINGKNAIYYFDELIANSLEEFLIRFNRDLHYFEKND